MKNSTVHAIAWISTAIAVSVAVYVTKSAAPLLGMFIPAIVTGYDKKENSKQC